MTLRKQILEKYPDAQISEAGQVAIRRYTTIPKIIKDCPSGLEYLSSVRANICLVWVELEDVDCVLAKYHTCCGGNKRKEYFLCDATHVRRWTNGGGR